MRDTGRSHNDHSQPYRYTTYGSVRQGCGHRHRTLDGAIRCLAQDAAGCARQGGYSDRRVYEVRSNGYLYTLGGDAESWVPGQGGRSCGGVRL